MTNSSTQTGNDGTICKSPPVQRRYCVYFHERTGRCTMSADSLWQSKAEREAERTSPDADAEQSGRADDTAGAT